MRSVVICGVGEDCKSLDFGLRWFESNHPQPSLYKGFSVNVLLALTVSYMLHGTMMGQLKTTLHSKSLKCSGYFQFAYMRLEVAFFIGLKNLNQSPQSRIFLTNLNLNVPQMSHILFFSSNAVSFSLSKSLSKSRDM